MSQARPPKPVIHLLYILDHSLTPSQLGMFDLWHFDNADDAVMQVKREPVAEDDRF